MTTTDPTAIADTSLAALVTARPAAARVFERVGIDYCCGGAISLGRACADAGVAVDQVLAGLGRLDPEPAPDWAALDIVGLVDHLVATHHAYLGRELPRLEALMDRVLDVHGDHHPELHRIRVITRALRADLEPHLQKEERVLFPMVRELAAAPAAGAVPEFHCGSLTNPIGVMRHEHDRAGALLAELRTATLGFAPPPDACASYRQLFAGLADLEADTHLHVHKENNVLFPRVAELERALRGG